MTPPPSLIGSPVAPALDPARKFLTLDALRGVAALAVVEFHAASFAGERLVRHGYLAVDFFFLLSGFVLSFAYGRKLDDGWRSADFFRVRAIRLYPLYALGLLLGLLLRLADHLFGKPALPAGTLLAVAGAGALLVPVPLQFAGVSAFAFPLNIPAWSLFFEAVANLVHGWFLRRRGLGFLGLTVAAAAAVLAAFALHAGSMDLGAHRTELLPGLARVVLSYTGGVLLYGVWQRGLVRFAVPAWASALILLALLIGLPEGSRFTLAYDAVAVLVCFPLLLLASANSRPTLRLAPLFQWLGVGSYAVYILHVPLAAAYFAVCARVLHGAVAVQAHALAETVLFLILIAMAAVVADRWYDAPVRAWLRRILSATAAPAHPDVPIAPEPATPAPAGGSR